jgi:hypothetical protein
MKNYNLLNIDYKKKQKKFSLKTKIKRKNKKKIRNYTNIIIFSAIILIIIILFKKFPKNLSFKTSLPFNYNKIYKKEKETTNSMKVCVCTLAKLENKYIREFVQHYENYGVDKIFLYDNNDINGEKFEEVIDDYIKKGFVQILNWRGKYEAMKKIMDDCYQQNNKNYDWLLFYEIDEFIHLSDYSNIKFFLNEQKFAQCKKIYLNLVCHTDNNKLYYENKPLKERFPQIVPNTKPGGQVYEVKTIMRGHMDGVFIFNNHLCDEKIKGCNSTGKYDLITGGFWSRNIDQKHYIDHYYSKSTEEFINKITKGDAIRNDPGYIYERIHKYFMQSEITKEKIDMIEKKAKVYLHKYKKLINYKN